MLAGVWRRTRRLEDDAVVRLLDVEEALQPGLREHLRLSRLDGLIRGLRGFREAGLDDVAVPHDADHRVRVEAHGRRLRTTQDVARPLRHLDHELKRSGIVALPVPDFVPILKSRRYVFGETDSFYGVWDRRAEAQPLEEFPLTPEGFELAEARFHGLKRRDRHETGVLHRASWGVLLGGLVVSFATGLTGLWHLFVDSTPATAKFFQFSYALGALGQRMAFGGLMALAGLTLVQRQALAREEASEPPRQDAELPGWEYVARWAMIAALSIWIASTFVTHLLYRPPALTFTFDPPPETAVIVAYTVESFAFRIWVAAFMLLLVAWGRSLLLRRDGNAVTPG